MKPAACTLAASRAGAVPVPSSRHLPSPSACTGGRASSVSAAPGMGVPVIPSMTWPATAPRLRRWRDGSGRRGWGRSRRLWTAAAGQRENRGEREDECARRAPVLSHEARQSVMVKRAILVHPPLPRGHLRRRVRRGVDIPRRVSADDLLGEITRIQRGAAILTPALPVSDRTGLHCRMRRSVVTLALLSLVGVSLVADNWPHWRGPSMNGVSTETALPTTWGPTTDVAWKLPLPAFSGSTPSSGTTPSS